MTESSTDSLVERLREGPIRTGYTEDGEYELFDIEEAAQTMTEAADRISTLERELEESRGIIMSREALHAANLGVDFDRISVLTARDMARQALDAKADLEVAEAKVVRMGEALKALDAPWIQFINCWADPSGDPAYDDQEEKGNVKALADAMDKARSALQSEKDREELTHHD
jgi:hypothetical protein